jgi:hypothetical protein
MSSRGGSAGLRRDTALASLRKALTAYESAHPGSAAEAYRRHAEVLRLRVVDPRFRRWPRERRHDRLWDELRHLPEEVLSQITLAVLLAPEERDESLLNVDFEEFRPTGR